jgi:hypothetical protein
MKSAFEYKLYYNLPKRCETPALVALTYLLTDNRSFKFESMIHHDMHYIAWLIAMLNQSPHQTR